MSVLGIFHGLCGALSLALGAGVLLQPKGTPRHVWLGRAYVSAMLCLNLTALAIYRLTGTFNIFHVLALVSLITLLIGFLSVRRRNSVPRWLWRHYQYMCWSYVGLLAATINEASIRIAPLKRWITGSSPVIPLAASLGLVIVSALIIRVSQDRVLKRFGSGT